MNTQTHTRPYSKSFYKNINILLTNINKIYIFIIHKTLQYISLLIQMIAKIYQKDIKNDQTVRDHERDESMMVL